MVCEMPDAITPSILVCPLHPDPLRFIAAVGCIPRPLPTTITPEALTVVSPRITQSRFVAEEV
jgi:hypothetical protein